MWAPADPTAYYGNRPPTVTHLAELEFLEKGDNGRWGALDVIPTYADYVLDLIRLNSLWPLLSGLACCAMEMMSAATSVNDMDRFNMFPFRASPRQADVLIVAGTLTTKMAGPLVRLWEQMPEPKWCVAMGDCTCSGGRYKRSYATVEGHRPRAARRRLRARLSAAPGRPDLRDDEAAAAHPRAARPLGRAGRRTDGSGRRLSERRRSTGPSEEPTTDTQLKRRLDDRFGRVLLAPAGQRQDTTELRVRAGDVTDVLTALHDDPELRFELLADLGGVDTGETMQVVYHLWSPLSPDWVRVIATASRATTRASLRSRSSGPAPNGPSARPTTCSGSSSRATATCGASTCSPTSSRSRCARTSCSPTTRPARRGWACAPMEQPSQPAETRRQPVLRRSPGTGALIGSDGQMLVIAAGSRGQRQRAGRFDRRR